MGHTPVQMEKLKRRHVVKDSFGMTTTLPVTMQQMSKINAAREIVRMHVLLITPNMRQLVINWGLNPPTGLKQKQNVQKMVMMST